MKNLYTWLVIRAYKIKEVETNESLALTRTRQKRNERKFRNAAVLLALSSVLLVLITFFMPGLKAHYKFSSIYNTASIMNTCSGCFMGIGFLILFVLVDSNNKQQTIDPATSDKP